MHWNKKKNNTLFWILQFFGWTFYGVLTFYLFTKGKYTNFLGYFLYYLTFIVGIFVSTGMRYFYRLLRRKSCSITGLIILLPITIVFAGLLSRALDLGISFQFWDQKGIDNFYTYQFHFRGIMKGSFNYFLLYMIWSTLYFGINYWIEWQQQKEKAEKAILLAQQAQLKMLRYQLNPHFLFNSLNSIRALIEEDKNSAKDMITELSEFLRYSLITDDNNYKTIQEEIEAIKHYFSIEKKRFEEKLMVSFNIALETEDFKIPGFLVHPLVENAVKYGMKTSPMPLKIEIKTYFEKDKMVIEVKNSGKWIEPKDKDMKEWAGTGKGLENVKSRLTNAFPGKFNYENYFTDNSVTAKIEIQKP